MSGKFCFRHGPDPSFSQLFDVDLDVGLGLSTKFYLVLPCMWIKRHLLANFGPTTCSSLQDIGWRAKISKSICSAPKGYRQCANHWRCMLIRCVAVSYAFHCKSIQCNLAEKIELKMLKFYLVLPGLGCDGPIYIHLGGSTILLPTRSHIPSQQEL